MYAIRQGPCVGCGVYLEKRRASIDPHRCLECGIKEAIKAAVEMHAKAGPAWDRYLASNAPGARAERARLQQEAVQ